MSSLGVTYSFFTLDDSFGILFKKDKKENKKYKNVVSTGRLRLEIPRQVGAVHPSALADAQATWRTAAHTRAASLQHRLQPQGCKLYTGLVLGCIEAKFASKYSLESSRRDLHNALLCTALESHVLLKIKLFARICQNLRVENGAKECMSVIFVVVSVVPLCFRPIFPFSSFQQFLFIGGFHSSALCRSRRELSNEYLLAKIGVDTAENEPLEVWGKIFNIIHWCPYSPTAVSSEVQRIDAAHVRVVAAERIRRAQGRALALTGR